MLLHQTHPKNLLNPLDIGLGQFLLVLVLPAVQVSENCNMASSFTSICRSRFRSSLAFCIMFRRKLEISQHQKDEQQEGSRLVAYSRDIQGDDHHQFTSTYLAPSCTILQHLTALLSSGWSDWWCCRFCPEDLHRTVWHPGPHHEKIGSYALHFVAICSLLFT